MRKLLFALLGCGLVVGAFLLFNHSGRFHHYRIGKEYTVRFNFPGLARQEFTEKEKADQDRDWLLYSLVAAAGLDKSQFAQVSFDLAPARYGFNATTANFDYGETRSKYLGDGQVIALVPTADEKTTDDNIAHILDDVRKNQGEIPGKVYLFEYTLNAEGNFARLTRRDNLDGKTFFTDTKGYFQQSVASAADLQSFMDTIDDITYAKLDNSALVLGGRRLSKAKGPYGKATPEDVAAIWQSEKVLAEKNAKRAAVKSDLDLLDSNYNRDIKTAWDDAMNKLAVLHFTDGTAFVDLPDDTQTEIVDYILSYIGNKSGFDVRTSPDIQYAKDRRLMRVIAGLKKEVVAIKSDYASKTKELTKDLDTEAPSASGFSLDPTVDCQRSIAFIQDHRPDFDNVLQEGITTDDLLEQLRQGNGDLMTYAIGRIHHSDLVSPELEKEARTKCMYQHARYDGELQGTAAGMTLFYTDLLAKIWGGNIFDSHQDINITDFRNLEQATVQTPVVFSEEDKSLPSCRLWFGPDKNGFQLGPGKADILFARNATQIFALAHDPADTANIQLGKMVTKEAQAPKNFEVVLNWWNNHYEEVAGYERQYQRLNEIMKWSTIIGWLNSEDASGTFHSFDFLDSQTVDHSLWFPTWAKTQKDLKFTEVDKINFYDSGARGNKTEALPLLISANEMFSGGVSLADRSMVRDAPELLDGSNSLFRRANLARDPMDANAFTTFKETKISIVEDAVSDNKYISLTPKDGIKLRSRYGEVANTNFRVDITGGERSAYALEEKIGDLTIGKLSVGTMKGNSFSIGFESGDVDRGLALGKEISDFDGEPGAFLKNHPDVARAVSTGDHQWAVQLKGSDKDKWAIMDIDAEPTVNLPDGWTARVSGSQANSRIVEIKWVSRDELQGMLGGKDLPPVMTEKLSAEEQKIAGLGDQVAAGDKKAAEDLKTARDQWLEEAKKPEAITDYDEANAITDKLLYYLGDDPQLLKLKATLNMRAALHAFENGNPGTGTAWLNDLLASPINPQDGPAFFKEVDNWIAHSDLTPFAKKRVGDVAKLYFTDEQVVTAGTCEGYGRLAKEVTLDQALASGHAKIIYADNMAFVDIDPKGSFETTIGQIRAIPGIRVYDISGEEIGRNTRLYATIDKNPGSPGGGLDPFDPSVSRADLQLARVKVRVFPGSAYNDCQRRDQNGNCEDKYSANGHIYFVTAPTLN
jgi:hypothetical protein